MTKQGVGQEPSTTEFDPSTVPPYPVITLTGADDPDNVTVDQQRYEGEDAYDRALQACVTRANELGGAVRIRGVSKDGTEWPLVVTADGELHELTSATNTKGGTSLSRRQLLIGGGLIGSMVVMAGGAVGGVALWQNSRRDPPPPPPPKYPGKGANLPVLPPSGIETQAQWAVLIDDRMARAVQLLSNGQMALPSTEGQVALVDAVTGQLQWTGKEPSQFGVLDLLEADGRTMLANYSDRGIDVWELSDPNGPSPHHIELDQQIATPLVTGEGALFALGSQTAQFLADGDLTLVDIPVPAVPAGLRAQKAVAVDHTGWIEIDAGGGATRSDLADLPEDARIEDARVLGTNLLAARWKTSEGTVLTAHSLPDGDLIGTAEVRGSGKDPLMSPKRTAWVWDDVLITANDVTALEDYSPEGSSFSAETVTDTEVWGSAGQTPARLPLESRTVMLEDPEAVIPVATLASASLAFIVATKLEETILHALAMDPATASASDGGGASDDGGTP